MGRGASVGCLALVAAVTFAGCGSQGAESPSRPPGGTLYVETQHGKISAIDVSSGEMETREMPRLGLGDPPFFLVYTGDRLVFYGSGGATYAIDPDLEGPTEKLGGSWYFVPSATAGRVWLTFLDRESPATVRDLRAVKEVTVDGEGTVVAGARPPCSGPTVVAAVEGALLCEVDQGLKVFDPRTGEVRMRLPQPFVTDTVGTLVAWCGEPCPRLHISDVATGEDEAIEHPESFRFRAGLDGAFSPDGSLLALPVFSRGCPTGVGEACRLAILDLDKGTGRLIDAPKLGTKLAGSHITWSSSGERLFFLVRGGRIMAYSPETERAAPLPISVDDLKIIDMAAD